ncbi:MAG: ABC transporter permease [Candidatus Paceibacterota bacterium]|jgi:putative ABC transport system permease protein
MKNTSNNIFLGFLALTMKGIRHRPIRSWLTIIGIVIAVMLVVVIMSLGTGIQSMVNNMLQKFGSDLIMVYPGKESVPVLGFVGGQKFRLGDLADLENIEGVKFVLPMDMGSIATEYSGDKQTVLFHAAPWKELRATMEESQGITLLDGRWPTNDDVPEVVIGFKTAMTQYKKPVRVNDDIIIKSSRFKIVGVMSEIGNQGDDNTVYISMKLFRSVTGRKAGAMAAMVKVYPGYNIELISRQIKSSLSKQEVVRDFSVLTPQKAGKIVGDVISIIETGLIMMALISLLVGAVGVMNTMYTSVLERTRQIGVMKAVGASRDAILSLFVIESGVIGLIGGVMGILLGIVFSFFVGILATQFGVNGLFNFWDLDFGGFFVVLIITFITGIISGILPAKRAADMEPAEALRYE